MKLPSSAEALLVLSYQGPSFNIRDWTDTNVFLKGTLPRQYGQRNMDMLQVSILIVAAVE